MFIAKQYEALASKDEQIASLKVNLENPIKQLEKFIVSQPRSLSGSAVASLEALSKGYCSI